MSTSQARASIGRCLCVWLVISAAAGAVLWFLSPDALALTAPGGRTSGSLDVLLARWGALVGGVGVLWLWVVGSVAVAEGLTGRVRTRVAGCPLAVRRLVLAACGVAISAGLFAPAYAGQVGVDDHAEQRLTHILSGLPLPERPSVAEEPRSNGRKSLPHLPAQVQSQPQPQSPAQPRAPAEMPAVAAEGVVVVRAGDSLWSIAESAIPAARRSPADVADLARRLYLANRDLIGADPDLIHPRQHLQLPPQLREER